LQAAPRPGARQPGRGTGPRRPARPRLATLAPRDRPGPERSARSRTSERIPALNRPRVIDDAENSDEYGGSSLRGPPAMPVGLEDWIHPTAAGSSRRHARGFKVRNLTRIYL